MILNNFIYSGLDFSEDESHLKFKFKMINSVLLIVAFFSALFGVLSDMGLNELGAIHTKVNYVYAFLTLGLIFFLRRDKKNYTLASHALLLFSVMTFTSALLLVPQDEFRMIWFYLLVFVAFILKGSYGGLFYTALSIAVIITANILTTLHISQVGINSAVLGLVIGGLLSWIYTNKIESYEMSLNEKNEELRQLASIDGLTGIINRRSFDELSKRYFETAHREKKELALLVLDLDFFKTVNDRYGHQVGDILLIRFAKAIEPLLRKSDIFGRIGGEEFAILLFHTDLSGGLILSKKIHEALKDIALTCEDEQIGVTCSIGISQIKQSDTDFYELFKRADKALYQAKDEGRNRSSCF
jgi:diguanylate cyclase (GGDEF)-like protein